MRAVILAGGKGRRLQPYTTVLPKPLIPVNERPILEIIVRQLKKAGFSRLTFAVGHLHGLIKAFFKNGESFGIQIDYSTEEIPLGTAGPLSLVETDEENFLVMNGDILTDLDFARMMEEHCVSGALATLAVYQKTVQISLGVLQIDKDDHVRGYTEKPTLHYDVSTGIYCFNRQVLCHLARGVYCDLPDLVLRLIARQLKVEAFRHEGYWLDIGNPDDYEIALDEEKKGRFG